MDSLLLVGRFHKVFRRDQRLGLEGLLFDGGNDPYGLEFAMDVQGSVLGVRDLGNLAFSKSFLFFETLFFQPHPASGR